jgi:hypothetical protein
MKASTTYCKDSRPVLARVTRMVSVLTFGVLICVFSVGSVRADDEHHGHDRGRGHEERHEREFRGRGYYPGRDYVYNEPDYYYAPEPDYYAAPDPYGYYYQPGPEYYPPAPSDGINLFFGR